MIAASVVVYVLIFRPLGFILSTALMMVAGAQILGDRGHLLRDLIVGVGLAITVAFVFGRLLNINLPPGLVGF